MLAPLVVSAIWQNYWSEPEKSHLRYFVLNSKAPTFDYELHLVFKWWKWGIVFSSTVLHKTNIQSALKITKTINLWKY